MSSIYKQQLITAFNRMQKETSNGNKIFCDAIIQNLESFILRSTLSTIDSGSISGGSYSGVTIKVNSIANFYDTSSLLYQQINSMTEKNANIDVATYIINNAKLAIEGSVLNTTTNGTLTMPNGATSAMSIVGTSKITTLSYSSDIIGLNSNFESMTEKNTDIDVATYITNWVKALLSANISTMYGTVSGSGTITPN